MWEKIKEKALDTASAVAHANLKNPEGLNVAKDSLINGASKTIETLTSAKETIANFSIENAVKDFAVKSADIVEQIDNVLTDNQSIYEVSSFRVGANAGVVGGMTLQIDFSKTSDAKTRTNNKKSYLEFENPNTGKLMKVLRSTFGTKEIGVVRDPNTGDIIEINVRTSEVISVKKSPN